MARFPGEAFDPALFLASAGLGRRIVHVKAKQEVFCQGAPADCVYYLQSGRARFTAVSRGGKEATVSLLAAGNFIGGESIAGASGRRLCSATAITTCKALKIECNEMIRVLHEERAFSDVFL